jgi:alkane 1-monooxygenase
MMKDAKYLIAYVLPLTAVAGLMWQGWWCWAAPVLAFALIPLLEQWLPQRTENVAPEGEESRTTRRFFDWLLYLNVPLVFGIVLGYAALVGSESLTWVELAGLTLGVGIIVGANGINVAHELGHRRLHYEQRLSKWLLLPALYQHFFIEHNRGHHKHVATPLDPATARLGEHVYAFWWRSVTGGWRSAWQLEAERLQKAGLPVWSVRNEMLHFTAAQMLWIGGIGFTLGPAAAAGAVMVAFIGFLLLETINYLEHYGLQRQLRSDGRYEPVLPRHSWNSNHELGRIFLYELTRHSDHHYKSTRKYQILRHIDESPQLPLGYPASILMALAPPLWFYVMNPRVPNSV